MTQIRIDAELKGEDMAAGATSSCRRRHPREGRGRRAGLAYEVFEM